MSERHDCWHSCCEERRDPHHDHFLQPDQCPGCLTINGYEFVDGEWLSPNRHKARHAE